MAGKCTITVFLFKKTFCLELLLLHGTVDPGDVVPDAIGTRVADVDGVQGPTGCAQEQAIIIV